MKTNTILSVVTAILMLTGIHPAHGQKRTTPKPVPADRLVIIADPDVRISYDGPVAHMEAYITASATHPDLLLAGGEMIVPGRELPATEARLYYSTDAGARWMPVLLPDEIRGGWDNALAAGTDGRLYFLTSNLQRGLTMYRSKDSGRTWAFSVIQHTQDWDRPHIVVDHTTGPYRGRLYIVGESEKGVGVISSPDGGQTFTAPVIACTPPAGMNVSTTAGPVVLSNGKLVVPCAPYPNFPARASWKEAEVGLVTSTDGGQQFTPYRPALTIHRSLPSAYYPARVRGDVLLSGNFMPGPSFAAAPPGSSRTDQLYAAWQDIDSTGRSQLLFAYSTDEGTTWSAPQPADPSLPATGNANQWRQGAPMLAVNREGVIGVAWLDGRGATDHKGYDVYFTASAGGGLHFLPAVRLSSATSQPARQGSNTLPSFLAGKASTNGQRTISMASPFSTRSTGADYATMTVDAAGRFHPLWTDAREGMAWQLYTSTVRVIPEKTLQALAQNNTASPAGNTTPSATNASAPCILDDRIQLLLGEPQWNAAGDEVMVPVRLLNTSSATIIEPIGVQVSGAALTSSRAKAYATEAALPQFFDPATARFSDSTQFVYPVSMQAPLFPNGVTSILPWRLRITQPAWVDFTFRATVTGGGCLLVK